jgi:hypothetical protein
LFWIVFKLAVTLAVIELSFNFLLF